MSWPKPDDPEYGGGPDDEEVPTVIDPPEAADPNPTVGSAVLVESSHHPKSSEGHGPATDRAAQWGIHEKVLSLDGRVERIESSGRELVVVAHGVLLWLRILVVGLLLLGAGFLGVAVIGVGAALVR